VRNSVKRTADGAGAVTRGYFAVKVDVANWWKVVPRASARAGGLA